MTDVWCRDKYCIHNEIGKCALDSIGLEMYDRMLFCKQYDDGLSIEDCNGPTWGHWEE